METIIYLCKRRRHIRCCTLPMKTIYANVKHPDRLCWLLGIVAVLGLALYFILMPSELVFWQIVRLVLYIVAIVAGNLLILVSVKCTVDDESGTLFTPENKKKPMLIADIDRITRVTNRKGRVRYLNIHEAGVRFVDVRLFPARADDLVAHLTSLNPAIKVQTKSYL